MAILLLIPFFWVPFSICKRIHFNRKNTLLLFWQMRKLPAIRVNNVWKLIQQKIVTIRLFILLPIFSLYLFICLSISHRILFKKYEIHSMRLWFLRYELFYIQIFLVLLFNVKFYASFVGKRIFFTTNNNRKYFIKRHKYIL